jgi:hypothetical protein
MTRLNFVGCWNGKLARSGAFEDAVHVLGGAARLVVNVESRS